MNTYGWDTVFVADIATINAALSKSTAQLVETFEFNSQGFEVNGEFGDWSIVPGGSGNLLLLQLDITSGELTSGTKTAKLAGLGVIVKISLELLPSPSGEGSVLAFDFKQVGAEGGGGAGVVSPHGISDPNNVLTPLMASALQQAVAQTLVQNASKISFVFATVNPTAASAAPWLRPTATAYLYEQLEGTTTDVLALLNMTANRGDAGLQQRIDPSVLAGTGNAAIGLSTELFMANVFRPALAQSLDTSPSKFQVAATGVLTSIGSIAMKTVSAAGESYHPNLTKVVATVQDTLISIEVNGGVSMGMNISMTFRASSRMSVSFSNGSLKFATYGKPSFSKSVNIPWYDHLFDVFGGVPEIILQATVAAIGSELGDGIASSAAASEIPGVAPKLVSWAGSDGFTPTQAGLATGLYVRGQIG